MSHAYSRNYVHLVFSTSERRKWIRNPAQTHAQMRDVIRSYGADAIEVGGTSDHVHLLIGVPPKIAAATLVRATKANTSKAMNEAGHLFAWQKGYGCFSVSASNLDAVRAYIQKQQAHHATRSFEDEFKALLTKHGIQFTPEKVLGLNPPRADALVGCPRIACSTQGSRPGLWLRPAKTADLRYLASRGRRRSAANVGFEIWSTE